MLIGATNVDDATAIWSNHGSCTDLFAPGVDITSLRIDGSEPSPTSGTSQAAAYVAGAVARVHSSAEEARGPVEV